MKNALLLVVVAALIATFSFAAGPQEKKAADRYAAYCGQYQFDLSAYGAGIITAKIYVENDEIYVLADMDDGPDKISPAENSETKFFLDDPDEGHWDFEFLKDDAGKFTKCRIINAEQGVDAIGVKIDG
jgi:hypothetical protein